jgi:hypothetical protein
MKCRNLWDASGFVLLYTSGKVVLCLTQGNRQVLTSVGSGASRCRRGSLGFLHISFISRDDVTWTAVTAPQGFADAIRFSMTQSYKGIMSHAWMSARLVDKSRKGAQLRGVFECYECVSGSSSNPSVDEPMAFPILVIRFAWICYICSKLMGKFIVLKTLGVRYKLCNSSVVCALVLQRIEFFLRQRVRTGCGAHPASYSMRTRGEGADLSLAVKQSGHDTDYLHVSSAAEVKDGWSYTSLPLCTFMACTGTNLHFTYDRQSAFRFKASSLKIIWTLNTSVSGFQLTSILTSIQRTGILLFFTGYTPDLGSAEPPI